MEKIEIRSHFLHSLYKAALEILGEPEAQRIFSTAIGWNGKGNPDADVLNANFLSKICSEFAINYHQNTAQGLLVRIGDAAFPFMKKNINALSNLGSIENRLKPNKIRFAEAINVLGNTLADIFGFDVEASMEKEVSYCLDIPESKTGFSGDLYLYFIGGMLRAFGTWLDSRRMYAFDMPEKSKPVNMRRICLQIKAAE